MIKGHYEVYRSGFWQNQWRWRFVARNGKKIFAATESYNNMDDCMATIPDIVGNTEIRIIE